MTMMMTMMVVMITIGTMHSRLVGSYVWPYLCECASVYARTHFAQISASTRLDMKHRQPNTKKERNKQTIQTSRDARTASATARTLGASSPVGRALVRSSPTFLVAIKALAATCVCVCVCVCARARVLTSEIQKEWLWLPSLRLLFHTN